MKTVLIIDDEEKLRNLLSRVIKSEGFDVLEAGTCKGGLKILESNTVPVILCDVKLPDGNGVELLKKIKDKSPTSEVILLTAYGNIQDGVQAMKNGAFDYIVKGDDNEKIIPLVHRAIEKALLHERVNALEDRIQKKFSFDTIIARSKSIQQAIELAKKVSPNNTTVLLTGETGTGKEVFAQAIHQASSHARKSFVALNCSTFGKDILESELFGYKQGAFTGAVKDKKGLLEEANGGTLFLDEIGEMPIELQAKLLRVLETNEFIKIGDTKSIRSDFRLIAATNKDLKTESEAHRFRADLYFRLNVFEIHIPPLRERVKDIEALTLYFVEMFSAKMNRRLLNINNDFIEKLKAYHWAGNVRELKNIIERCVILADADMLTASVLPYEIQQGIHSGEAHLPLSLENVEKLHIQKVLNHTKGNKAEAARLLDIGIATLYRKLEDYKIQ